LQIDKKPLAVTSPKPQPLALELRPQGNVRGLVTRCA